MSVLILSASVDPAAHVPSLAPAYPAGQSQYTECRQRQYIMMNVVPPLGQALQMFHISRILCMGKSLYLVKMQYLS